MLDADAAVFGKLRGAPKPDLHRRAGTVDLDHQAAAEQAEPLDRAAVRDRRGRLQQAFQHPVLAPDGRGGTVRLQGRGTGRMSSARASFHRVRGSATFSKTDMWGQTA